MRRRELLTGAGAIVVAVALPGRAQSQDNRFPVIGYLSAASARTHGMYLPAFREGLKENGLVEGENVRVEYRWAEGSSSRLKVLAEELLKQQVAVVFAAGSAEAVTVKHLTSTTPVVFTGSSDPVALGLVSSLSRPGGNATGITRISHAAGTKRLELLQELVPQALVLAALFNPRNPSTSNELEGVQRFADAVGRRLIRVKAETPQDVSEAIDAAVSQGAQALWVGGDPLLNQEREKIAQLALTHRLPTIAPPREFAASGGLMAYGPSFMASYRQAGLYTGQILRGSKAADLPVHRLTDFQLVLNLATARALAVEFPASLLAQADEVIE